MVTFVGHKASMWGDLPADVLRQIAGCAIDEGRDLRTAAALSCVSRRTRQALESECERLARRLARVRDVGLRWKRGGRAFQYVHYIQKRYIFMPRAIRESDCLLRFSWIWLNQDPIINLESLVVSIMFCAWMGAGRPESMRLCSEVFGALNDALAKRLRYDETCQLTVGAVPVAWFRDLSRDLGPGVRGVGFRTRCWLQAPTCPVAYISRLCDEFGDEEDLESMMRDLLPGLLRIFASHSFYRGVLLFGSSG